MNTKSTKEYTVHCPNCDSQHVMAKTIACWDVISQAWDLHPETEHMLSTIPDPYHCGDCRTSYKEYVTKEIEIDHVPE